MIGWIRLALLNLSRNRRRSAYAIIIVAVGFAGINVFGGFTRYIFTSLKESYIYTMGNGHLIIARQRDNYLPDTSTNPSDYMLSAGDISVIRREIGETVDPIMIYQTLYLSGLISNGEFSTIFVSLAAVPSEFYAVQALATGMLARIKYFDGAELGDVTPDGIGIGRGLAYKLNSQLGSSLVLLVPTIHGQINTKDAQVIQFSDTTQELLDDKLVLMPMSLAQDLLMYDGALRVHVLLKNEKELNSIQQRLSSRLDKIGLKVSVFTWRDISPFYNKVEGMFHVIFFFIFLVVSSIIIISIVNTLSMSILERTREIGTMRAMGARRSHIATLFCLESGLLGVIGCLFGLLLWGTVLVGVSFFAPQWIPPHITRSIPLEIHPDFIYLASSGLVLVALSCLSGIIPSRRIAYLNISKALNNV